ncbi:ABC transporter substrate-binding protein (plasmid) [Sinorhizobium meliloti]|uniref:ABC transporter substrate-binding protein n=1 Tax=Rhizobium meliloti TaxID=382 RepID=UPI002D77C2F4|nr:ABC transporter substrate-binding protein [Sinorhizobium meliloti]WRQ72061.1 ABC transporter substrate-binding protein [Sinorhizobium meliloti]
MAIHKITTLATTIALLAIDGGLAQPVKIGCLYPLSGPAGLYGRDSAIAIRLAQRRIESLRGAGYPELEIIVEDTRSKPLRSLQFARKFIDTDQVDFLCGVVSSGIALSITELARQTETFFIGTDHASPSLVSTELHPFYFRVSNDIRLSMLAGAKYIRDQYSVSAKPLRIAFIGPDYEYGYEAWEDLRWFLQENGVDFEVVGEFWPKLFETDYSIYVEALDQVQPDVIVDGHWGVDVVTLIKQAAQHGLLEKATFMNFDAGGNYEVLAQLGNDVPLGLVLSARHHVNWPPTQSNRDFVQAFHEEAGRFPSYAAEGAYSGILAIAEAVKAAGSAGDADAIRSALSSLKLKLPEDPEGFVSFMDPLSHQMMQAQAIGRTVVDNRFLPATRLLGGWSVYLPPRQWPETQRN